MKKVLAFAGSNSKKSINKQFVELAVSKLNDVDYNVLDLNDYELPLFNTDVENELGYPKNALIFNELIENSSGIILSLAEHNGSYSAVFKNLFDWLSRIDAKTWKKKPMLLLSTSPGGRGGASVMETAKARFPYHDSNIIESFSLPNFYDNFSKEKLMDTELHKEFLNKIRLFENSIVN